MSRDFIGASIDKGLAFVAVGVAAVVAVIIFVVRWSIEDTVWDSVGQGFASAGQGGLAFAWNALGIVLTIVALAGIALWVLSRLGVTGDRGGRGGGWL